MNHLGLANNNCVNQELSGREILSLSEYLRQSNCQATDPTFRDLENCYEATGYQIRENYQLAKELEILTVVMDKMQEIGVSFKEHDAINVIKAYEAAS